MQKLLDALTVSHLFLVLGSLIEYWSFFYTTGCVLPTTEFRHVCCEEWSCALTN